eukprot:767024-Hanusia_phi.AAC.1
MPNVDAGRGGRISWRGTTTTDQLSFSAHRFSQFDVLSSSFLRGPLHLESMRHLGPTISEDLLHLRYPALPCPALPCPPFVSLQHTHLHFLQIHTLFSARHVCDPSSPSSPPASSFPRMLPGPSFAACSRRVGVRWSWKFFRRLKWIPDQEERRGGEEERRRRRRSKRIGGGERRIETERGEREGEGRRELEWWDIVRD